MDTPANKYGRKPRRLTQMSGDFQAEMTKA